MSLAELEAPRLDALRSLYGNAIGPRGRRAVAVAVAIRERVFRIVKLLDEDIDDVWIVDRVTPTEILVVADRRIRRAEERRAAQVPTLLAVNVTFIPLTRSEEGL